jgi:hypothetical protein
MSNLLTRILLLIAVVMLLSGCIHQPGGIAASNVPLDGRAYHVIGETEASDNVIRILGLIPITGSNKTRVALNEAIRRRDADALINITVELYTQNWILFTRTATAVYGTAIKFDSPEPASQMDEPSP